MHNLSLITTLAAGFTGAWLLGLVTQRLGLSSIVGYLLAGVLIGPHTPGFVGDAEIAQQLAEVGVILMMFGVGLHFHLKDLLAVRRLAVPGAVVQSLVATLLFQETQSITGILHRIESRGWVRRLPDPNDRRAVGLELTDDGRAITGEIMRISDELYGEMFGNVLTANDKKTIEAILKKVRSVGFKMPETDFKLRRAQQYTIWKD